MRSGQSDGHGIRRGKVAVDRGNRIGAPAGNGKRGVRLVGKWWRQPGTTATATASSPSGPYGNHN